MTITNKVLLFVLLSLTCIAFGCSFDSGSGTNTPVIPANSIPHNPTPANGATNQPSDLYLSWQSDNAVSYDIYFEEGVNPPTILAYGNLTQNYVSVPNSPLSAGKTYYWKVIAKYADGSTAAGPVWNFTTSAIQTQGYAMYQYYFGTQPPNIVDLMYQVVDLFGNGITTLTTADFILHDDGDSLSPTEAYYDVRKRSQTPYIIKTVLMLDNSTSISATDTSNISKIKNAAATFIRNILPDQYVSIYSFSVNINALQYNFTNDTTILLNSLNAYNAGGPSTNLYGAAIEGASRWDDLYSMNQVEQGVMIIFTDGSDTQALYSLSEALLAIGTKLVYTVGLRGEIDQGVLNLMGTAGSYMIDQADQITQQFLEIQNKIILYANSFYWLQYHSPRRGNRDHTLILTIKNNLYSGSTSYIYGIYNSGTFY